MLRLAMALAALSLALTAGCATQHGEHIPVSPTELVTLFHHAPGPMYDASVIGVVNNRVYLAVYEEGLSSVGGPHNVYSAPLQGLSGDDLRLLGLRAERQQ